MYKIEKTAYGVKITFAGGMSKDEIVAWGVESEKVLQTLQSSFGIMIDMREMKPLAPDAQAEMQKGQKLYKEKGMERSVVILSSTIATLQFKRIAQESGIFAWERYIDASASPDWEVKGEKWLTNSIDPQ
jgi:hypothetical protein